MLKKLLSMNKYKGIFPALASALSLILSFVPVIYLAWIPKYQPVGLYFLLDFALVIFFVFLGITAFSLLVRIVQRIMKKSPFFKWYDILFFFLMTCLWGGALYNYFEISGRGKHPDNVLFVLYFNGFYIRKKVKLYSLREWTQFHYSYCSYVNFEFIISIALVIITFTLFFVFLKKQKKKSALLNSDISMAQ